MNAQADMAQRFEYDLWANLLWHDYLERSGWPEEEKGIFQHIQAAQEIWLTRVRGSSPSAMPLTPVDPDSIRHLNECWLEILRLSDMEEVISYKRTTGEELSLSIGDIARQVQNHGSYHRGELRGLCRAAKKEDFPETDFLRFIWSR